MTFASAAELNEFSGHDPAARDAGVSYWRRLPWTRVALCALGVVAIAQAALMATWFSSRATASVDGGQLTVTSEPPGAVVVVDGAWRGRSPITLWLSSGAHDLEVLGGTSVRTRTVNITRGSESLVHVELRIEPSPASTAAPEIRTGGLKVSSAPSGVGVSIDGRGRGTTPLTLSDLVPGRHEVVVRSGNNKVSRTVTVEAGSTASLFVAINAASEFASGWLTLSTPVPAQIFEEGTLIGTTDTPRVMLRAGRHVVEIANTNLNYHVKRTVEITAGRTTAVKLDAPQGTLHVNALPWAEVLVNGQSVGETPIGNLTLPIGTHELVFRHPDLGEQRKTVTVGVATPVRVGVDLRK